MTYPIEVPFHAADLVVFSVILLTSVGIGVFFSVTGGKQKSTEEFLMGERKMAVLPVGISMMASQLSAIVILGSVAEMYTQGTEYWTWSIAHVVSGVVSAFVFIPILYPLKLTSINEYHELRFNSRSVRLIGSALTAITNIIYMSLATFAPAIALVAVTGWPLWAVLFIQLLAAGLYTALGGFKAVVWTDVIQAVCMFVGVIICTVQASSLAGGFAKPFEYAAKYDRLNFFTLDADIHVRHSFWTVVVVSSMTAIGFYSFSQAGFQRYSAVTSLRGAKTSVLITMTIVIFLFSLACWCGVSVFGYYASIGCDVLDNPKTTNHNQILPQFVMETLSFPGIPGLFFASLFCGSLSSISSSLTSLCAITWEDLLKRRFGNLDVWKQTLMTKLLVPIFCIVSFGLASLLSEVKGQLVQVTTTLMGGSMAPMAGLMLLGITCPFANWIGAMVGAILGFIMPMWIGSMSYAYKFHTPPIPMPSNASCYGDDTGLVSGNYLTTDMANTTQFSLYNSSTTEAVPQHEPPSGLASLYTISYIMIPFIGQTTTYCFGVLISLITHDTMKDCDKPARNSGLMLPIVETLCSYLPEKWQASIFRKDEEEVSKMCPPENGDFKKLKDEDESLLQVSEGNTKL